MSAPVKITDATFDQVVGNSSTPVLVDFWAEWCGPCKMIAPVLEELSEELDGRLTIAKLDVDYNPDSATAYGVLSIPTLLVFKDGEAVDRIVGFQPKAQLLRRLQQHLPVTQAA